jgi:YVTN family beta-propeller protein
MRLPVSTRAGGVAVSPDGSKVYVADGAIGNVSVIDTATNTVTDTIGGNFRIQGLPAGGASNSVCGTTFGGNLAFDSNAAAVQIGSSSLQTCAGNTIGRNLEIIDNTGSALMFDNSVGGNTSVLDNTGPVDVVGNGVRGNLLCQGNTDLIMGGGNTASRTSGQCS